MFSNPIEMIQFFKQCRNPRDAAINMLEQRAQNDPSASDLLALVKQGNTKGVEEAVRKMVNSQGGNFDKDFNAFKKSWGFK